MEPVCCLSSDTRVVLPGEMLPVGSLAWGNRKKGPKILSGTAFFLECIVVSLGFRTVCKTVVANGNSRLVFVSTENHVWFRNGLSDPRTTKELAIGDPFYSINHHTLNEHTIWRVESVERLARPHEVCCVTSPDGHIVLEGGIISSAATPLS